LETVEIVEDEDTGKKRLRGILHSYDGKKHKIDKEP